MSESKHTPGPWQYDPDMRLVDAARDGDTERPTICDVLDTTEGLEGDCPQADANGEFIVLACNAYHDMLAALKAADRFITNGIEFGYITMPDPGTPDPARKTPGVVRAAIAKAEGRS